MLTLRGYSPKGNILSTFSWHISLWLVWIHDKNDCEVTFFTVIFKIAKQLFIKLEVEKLGSWKFSQSMGKSVYTWYGFIHHFCLRFLILAVVYFVSYTRLLTQSTKDVVLFSNYRGNHLFHCWVVLKKKKLKLNLDKHHLIASGNENAETDLDNFLNSNSKREKLHYLWW